MDTGGEDSWRCCQVMVAAGSSLSPPLLILVFIFYSGCDLRRINRMADLKKPLRSKTSMHAAIEGCCCGNCGLYQTNVMGPQEVNL